jgi:non-specific serine/threonine protein kinase
VTSKNTKLSWRWLSAELKRREVYPVIVTYAIVGWILLQIGEVTFDPLGVPEWVMPTLIVMVIGGFPVALVLAWMYDVTPKGVRRDRIPSPDRAVGDDKPSIAVLPFLDLSPAKDQQYSSSFQFSSQAGDVKAMGRKLGVETILEGSVRKSGRRLRVTAQLVKVADGYHIWSKEFDEDLEDVFAIQDEIAASIAESLVETISEREREAIRAVPRTDVNAYDYYLRGRQFFKRFHKVDIEHARQMFWQALDIDPDFALAWAGYADCQSFLMMYVDPDPVHAQQADRASKRALELGPKLAEAHASRGLACLVGRDFKNAEASFREALQLNPRLFEAYYYYARTRFHQGDLDTLAIEEAREAVEVLEKHLEWHPDDARSLHLGAGPLITLGQTERAKKWLRRALELDPDDPVVLYNVACNFAILGESDESLDYLERAVEQGTVSSDWMRNDEDLVSLHSNPRYVALLQQVEAKEGVSLADA